MPFYSVIIPTYNRKEYLGKALESVLGQTFVDHELIIIDDGSTDGTAEFITQYKDPRIHYFFQKHRGVACARNRGVAAAGGSYIAFLDSDDWWLKDKLDKFYQAIKAAPEYKIFHSEERWYRQGRIVRPKKKHQKPDGYVYCRALAICCVSISTAVIHRDVFDKVGLFDETFEACEDYDFWLRATYHFPVKLIREYLTEKEGGRPDELSQSVWGLDRFRIKALAKMLASGHLSRDDYMVTLGELKKKAGVFIRGAQKRDKLKQAEFYKNLVEKHSRWQE